MSLWDELGATEMQSYPPPTCTCNGKLQRLPYVHIAGCRWSTDRLNLVEPTPKPAKKMILLTTGRPWISPRGPLKRKSIDRNAESPYKLVLQFFFQRPVNLKLWKKIKPPPGWRKCPTSTTGQAIYFGVRFQCRDLKHALTPDEVEELRARLNLSLELVF